MCSAFFWLVDPSGDVAGGLCGGSPSLPCPFQQPLCPGTQASAGILPSPCQWGPLKQITLALTFLEMVLVPRQSLSSLGFLEMIPASLTEKGWCLAAPSFPAAKCSHYVWSVCPCLLSGLTIDLDRVCVCTVSQSFLFTLQDPASESPCLESSPPIVDPQPQN